MKLSKQEGQTPHRASRYFLCLVCDIKNYLLSISRWFISFELKILKKARVRATAADLVTGQVLVETMVALAMVVIGLLGFLSLLSYSIGLNKVVADQYVASYLASEGIEVIKNIEDNNVARNLVSPTAYNAYLSSNPGYYEVSYDTQPPDVDIREVSESVSSLSRIKFDPTTKIYNYSVGDTTSFTRQIKITYPTKTRWRFNP